MQCTFARSGANDEIQVWQCMSPECQWSKGDLLCEACARKCHASCHTAQLSKQEAASCACGQRGAPRCKALQVEEPSPAAAAAAPAAARPRVRVRAVNGVSRLYTSPSSLGGSAPATFTSNDARLVFQRLVHSLRKDYSAGKAAGVTSPLWRCHRALLLHMANEYFSDADADALGRTCRYGVLAMKTYLIRHEFPFDEVLERAGFFLPSRHEFWMHREVRFRPMTTRKIGVVAKLVCGTRPPVQPPLLTVHSCWSTVRSLRWLVQDVAKETQTCYTGLATLLPSVTALTVDALTSDTVLNQLLQWQHLRTLRLGLQLKTDKVTCTTQMWNLAAAQLLSLRSLQLGGHWLADSVPLRLFLPPQLTELKVSPLAAEIPSPRDVVGLALDALQLPATLVKLVLASFLEPAQVPMHLPPLLRTVDLRETRLNQPLSALFIALPESLTDVSLPNVFDHSLDDVVWPRSLTRLVLGPNFSQPLVAWSPPASLAQFILSGDGVWNLTVDQLRLPDGLREWTFSAHFNQSLQGMRWPAALTELHLGDNFNQNLRGVEWPAQLHNLTLSKMFQQPLGAEDWIPPASLRMLRMGREWNKVFTSLALPPRLEKLELPESCDRPIGTLVLPPTLTSLSFGYDYKQPLLDWSPPESLTELRLGGTWNLAVSQLRLPPRLRTLTFGDNFDQNVTALALPDSLTALIFGTEFVQPLSVQLPRLPPHLRVLVLPSHHFALGLANSSKRRNVLGLPLQQESVSGHPESEQTAKMPLPPLPASMRELHVFSRAALDDLLGARARDLPAELVVSLQHQNESAALGILSSRRGHPGPNFRWKEVRTGSEATLHTPPQLAPSPSARSRSHAAAASTALFLLCLLFLLHSLKLPPFVAAASGNR